MYDTIHWLMRLIRDDSIINQTLEELTSLAMTLYGKYTVLRVTVGVNFKCFECTLNLTSYSYPCILKCDVYEQSRSLTFGELEDGKSRTLWFAGWHSCIGMSWRGSSLRGFYPLLAMSFFCLLYHVVTGSGELCGVAYLRLRFAS